MLNKCFKSQSDVDEMIRAFIKKNLNLFEDVIFNYAVMNKSNPLNFSIISNVPEWYELNYKQNNRQFTDPVVIRALSGIDNFYWDQQVMSQALGNVAIFDGAREFEILQGHTFVAHDEFNNVALLTVIRKTGTLSDFRQKIENNISVFKKILRECHTKNMKLRGIDGPVFFSGCKRYQLYKTADCSTIRPINQNEIIAPIETLVQILAEKGYKITRGNDNIASQA